LGVEANTKIVHNSAWQSALPFVMFREITMMKGETGERWRQLCEQAAVEQDSEKLLELVTQINLLLEEEEQRLRRSTSEASESVAWD
jgi:hypothetical protein